MNYKKILNDHMYTIEEGYPHPLGAIPDREGVNFSIFSEHADYVELLLFDKHDDIEPTLVLSTSRKNKVIRAGINENSIKLEKAVEASEITRVILNKTFNFWHVYIRGMKSKIHYAYRIGGTSDLTKGCYFDGEKVLLDPYSRGINKTLWDRGKSCLPGDNLATSMRSVVIDPSDYNWEDDYHSRLAAWKTNLNCPRLNDTIIYEMHVRGFTRSSTSRVKAPGTYSGVIEKIPYLKELGITAVELLPVFEFDDTENHDDRRDYWGYDPICFFAPHSSYCVNPMDGEHVREFQDMVKALHKAGIAVILDVVFNHTSEGDHRGPVFSFKGIANDIYYLLEPEGHNYSNYSGCGNTVQCNHPITQKLIVDCLKYWVKEMHVDGFRFDEGSIMTRGLDGKEMTYPPVIWQIELEDTLAYTKLISEAWDAGNLYQVGCFPGYRWAEWNGLYRDDIRCFVKGDPGLVGRVAYRIAGSSDLYQSESRLPINSINLVTCHDGFTLNDLVSYNNKHNDANGENNRDGIDNNLSWNCGVEGETHDQEVEALRERQIKNFASILLLSTGIPMICMGDEIRRTQKGNNNAYCQDNEISWFDWDLVEKNSHMFRFWKLMIDFRKRHPTLLRLHYFIGAENERGLKDIDWHGCKLHSPGWDDPSARVLAFTMGGYGDEEDIHVMLNMCWEPLEFEIPKLNSREWYRVIDTFLPTPQDIKEAGKEVEINSNTYVVSGRSIVVLVSK